MTENTINFFAGKIRKIRVTQSAIEYDGSVLVDEHLLELAGIPNFSQVMVINLATGHRWFTYALAHPTPGIFSLNGSEARYGIVGDPMIIVLYAQASSFPGAKVVFCDDSNMVKEVLQYKPDGSNEVIQHGETRSLTLPKIEYRAIAMEGRSQPSRSIADECQLLVNG